MFKLWLIIATEAGLWFDAVFVQEVEVYHSFLWKIKAC